jgi:hypothetical protein
MAMNCDNDQAASKRAGSLAKAEGVEIELWQEARKVATFKRQREYDHLRSPRRADDSEGSQVGPRGNSGSTIWPGSRMKAWNTLAPRRRCALGC